MTRRAACRAGLMTRFARHSHLMSQRSGVTGAPRCKTDGRVKPAIGLKGLTAYKASVLDTI
jgi:hypothetical protein